MGTLYALGHVITSISLILLLIECLLRKGCQSELEAAVEV